MVPEGIGTTHVTKSGERTGYKNIRLLAGLDVFLLQKKLLSSDISKIMRSRILRMDFSGGEGRLFLLRKKAKVADEKGNGATAFDRMCGRNMVSL